HHLAQRHRHRSPPPHHTPLSPPRPTRRRARRRKAVGRRQKAVSLRLEMFRGHRDLKVYQLAYKLAMEIFRASKVFPQDERYSLTDQIRRSSRSVAAIIA